MQVLVVGSGPAGLILGAALGGRGHHVISVDRDPGPSPDGWRRRGVMQFAHAHNFRPPGRQAPDPGVAGGVRRLDAARRDPDRRRADGRPTPR